MVTDSSVLQYVIYEFLSLLSETQSPQSPHNLFVLETLLHLLTDIETQLALIRTDLENKRLIYNDLHTKLLEEAS